MQKVYDQITALKKAATKREAEKKEMADVIEQEKLAEMKGELAAPRFVMQEAHISRSTSLRAQECLSPSTGRRQEDGW